MKPRILIVDDEVSICLFLSLALNTRSSVAPLPLLRLCKS